MSFLEIFRKLNNYIGTHKVHLCPEVNGSLLNGGEPLANVKITRLLYYSDGKSTEDNCYTDSNGIFSMPEKSLRSSQPSLLIAERFTSQIIQAAYGDKEHLLWAFTNSGIKAKAEVALKLRELNGDITNEDIFFSFYSHEDDFKYEASSICRWEDNFEEVIFNDDPYRYVNLD